MSTTNPFEIVNPQSLGEPKGFSHGVLAPAGGRVLFVAGQAGWEQGGPPPHEGVVMRRPPDFAAQFARALDKVLAVVREAGGEPSDVARLTIFVTDLAAYRASREALGEGWRERFGRYYPAMTLIEAKGLVDEGAMVEIEASAVIGGSR
jgi:enamine deaminase RidA (YjgF/YER057c/UK114 family)